MAEPVLEAIAVEEEAGDDGVAARPLPAATGGEVSFLRDEARTVAITAAGGVVAGAATVAVVKAASRAATPKRSKRGLRRRQKQNEIIASRSFLVTFTCSAVDLKRPLSRSGSLEIEVRPRSPYRLSTRGRADGVMRSGGRGAHAAPPRGRRTGGRSRLAAP